MNLFQFYRRKMYSKIWLMSAICYAMIPISHNQESASIVAQDGVVFGQKILDANEVRLQLLNRHTG